MIAHNDFIFNQGLIRTKCNQPGIPLHLVSRRRLSEKLTGALNHKLTIVTAPAGYGKSTAVIDWLEQVGLPSAWVSLDRDDNHSLMFWRYICAALDSIIDGIGNDLSNIFSSQELLKANLHLSILIDRLIVSQTDIILALDDFHYITETDLLDAFSYFISYIPPRVHVILLSRTEPELKLAKLGIKDELVRLNINDLRFQTEEIARFYETRGLFLEKDDLDRAEAYTEGWVAALVAITLPVGENRDRNQLTESLESRN